MLNVECSLPHARGILLSQRPYFTPALPLHHPSDSSPSSTLGYVLGGFNEFLFNFVFYVENAEYLQYWRLQEKNPMKIDHFIQQFALLARAETLSAEMCQVTWYSDWQKLVRYVAVTVAMVWCYLSTVRDLADRSQVLLAILSAPTLCVILTIVHMMVFDAGVLGRGLPLNV